MVGMGLDLWHHGVDGTQHPRRTLTGSIATQNATRALRETGTWGTGNR